MRISKEKLARLRSAAGRGAKTRAAGQRGAALQVVSGAVAGIAHYAGAARVDFIQKNWWAGPVILALAGVAANRSERLRGVGNALLGAAGYAGYAGYAVNAAKPETKGFEDAADTGLIGGSYQSYRAPYLDALPEATTVAAGNARVSPEVETIGLN